MQGKKARFRESGRDLILAVRLGGDEAWQEALNALAATPEMNPRRDGDRPAAESSLSQLGDQLGRTLTAFQRQGWLEILIHHPLSGMRRLGAFALPRIWDAPQSRPWARKLALDQKKAVQESLLKALQGLASAERASLAERWLQESEPELRKLGCGLIPLQPLQQALAIAGQTSQDPEPAVRAAAVDLLARLAQDEPGPVIEALTNWAPLAEPKQAQVIAQTLARNPLNLDPDRALLVLETLDPQSARAAARAVIGALRALARENEWDRLRSRLMAWRHVDPAHAALAERAIRRIERRE